MKNHWRLAQGERQRMLSILWLQSEPGHMEQIYAHVLKVLDADIAAGIVTTHVDKHDNIYITKGQPHQPGLPYPCFVAHMDTVHDIIPRSSYRVIRDRRDGSYFGWNATKGEATGIGGDDKIGIFIALEMLRDLPYAKVAFFADEEFGCIGSYEADISWFADVSCVIECDRRGNSDIVRWISDRTLYGDDFAHTIAPALRDHRYTETIGAMTDVLALSKQGLAVCSMNMSCGYYFPHDDDTYVAPNDVARALSFTREITALTMHKQWPAPPQSPRIRWQQSEDSTTLHHCEWCARYIDDDEWDAAQDCCLRCGSNSIATFDDGPNRRCPTCGHFTMDSSGWCVTCHDWGYHPQEKRREAPLSLVCGSCGTKLEDIGGEVAFCDTCKVCWINGRAWPLNPREEEIDATR